MSDERKVVLVIGPLPPPYHGGAVATSYVLGTQSTVQRRLLHLDTTDRRGLLNIGTVDAGNVLLALRHAAQLLVMLVRERPGVVYLPMAQNTLGVLRDCVLAVLALSLRARLVVHLHGSGFRAFHDAAPPPLRAPVRMILRRARRVIVLGESLRFMLEGIVPPKSVAVLPNGTEDLFADAPHRRAGGGPVRLLYLGNLMVAKGFPEVLEAAVVLVRDGEDVELHVAGAFTSAAERARAAEWLERLGSAVTLHGVVAGEAKRQLLLDADLFVFPSHSEGHPYVILEAMAAGLPIVATRLSTIEETIVDGESGVLVPPGKPAELAQALRALIRNPARRCELGRAARRRFESRYSLDRWSAGLDQILTAAAE
ncbi:MAG: glycosyltransferase family 4 protein [Gemmatimonadota bacterium]